MAAGLTRFIYTHGGRILYHDQYVDSENNHCSTRLKWDVSHFSMTDTEIAERLRAFIGSEPDIEWSLHSSGEVLRMAVFVSNDPSCLYGVLARSHSGEWEVEVPVVVSNHTDFEKAAPSSSLTRSRRRIRTRSRRSSWPFSRTAVLISSSSPGTCRYRYRPEEQSGEGPALVSGKRRARCAVRIGFDEPAG